MKKTIALLLALCLAGALLPAAAEETSPAGTWYALQTYMPSLDSWVTLSDSSSYSGTLTINEDGTLLLSETESGETYDQTGTWELTGEGMLRIQLPGINSETTYPMPFITIGANNTNITFSRSRPGPLTEPVLEITEEFVSMFYGTWMTQYVLVNGMRIDASVLGLDGMQFTIDDGTFTAAILNGGEIVSSQTYTCSCQGGGLSVNQTDSNGNFVSQIMIQYLQDAAITIPDIIPDVTLVCCKKTEE